MIKLRRTLSSKGFALGSAIIAVGIGVTGLTSGLLVQSSAQKSIARSIDKAYAESMAVSLLDSFQAMGALEIGNYLKTNPSDASNTNLYPLCAHINILDRTQYFKKCADGSKKLVNANGSPVGGLDCTAASDQEKFERLVNIDPNVKMGANRLTRTAHPVENANRFYQIQVVDVQTMQVLPQYCDKTNYVYDPVARPNEKFLITTGVSWIPSAGNSSGAQRVAFSSIIWE